ncbi:Glycosyltransferase [Actinidia chinensis var. chinensis]|uniref:Glycosyltransferase n=1 Tax=Actinidia chinensis var. chinensis TaxID=1590841 RepID=A0A2R6S0R1_ACTCC|nr:Glycosyltransferase [Actinidia chinensis var. chinensis]
MGSIEVQSIWGKSIFSSFWAWDLKQRSVTVSPTLLRKKKAATVAVFLEDNATNRLGEGDKEGCFRLKSPLSGWIIFGEGEACPNIIREMEEREAGGESLSGNTLSSQTSDRRIKGGRKVIRAVIR